MHGRLSAVHHDDSPLFAGIPQGFQAVRYHSLCVARPLPEWLVPIAWTDDGVLMGVAHRDRPQWGVQFHPESICTEHGRRLLENFRDLTSNGRRARNGRATACVVPRGTDRAPAQDRDLELLVERVDRLYDTERAFVELYGAAPDAFWLDSSRCADERSRFSFIGAAGGPLSAVVRYDVERRQVVVQRGAATEVHDESIFDYLRREQRRLRHLGADLPFDLDCGYVGYFGYELKADCEGDAAHRSPLPDAAFVLRRPADRLRPRRARHVRPLSRRRLPRSGGKALGARCSATARRPAAAPGPAAHPAPRRPRRVPAQPLVRALPRGHPAHAMSTSSRARRTRSASRTG